MGLAWCGQWELVPSWSCWCHNPLAGTGVGLSRALHCLHPSVLHLSPFPLPDPRGLWCRRLTADPAASNPFVPGQEQRRFVGSPQPGPSGGWVPAPELGQTSPRDRRVMPSRPAAPALRYSPGGGGGLVLPTLPGDPPGHPKTASIWENGETLLFPQMFHNAQSPWESLFLPTWGLQWLWELPGLPSLVSQCWGAGIHSPGMTPMPRWAQHRAGGSWTQRLCVPSWTGLWFWDGAAPRPAASLV